MLKPNQEAYNGPISFPLHSTLQALLTNDSQALAGNDLNLPYGAGDAVLEAGFVLKLVSEGGKTVVDIVNGTGDDADGVSASSLTDAFKSGKLDMYFLQDGGLYTVKGNYDPGQSYPVGTKLTFIATGANKGKLIPASVYNTQKIVAKVVEAPASAIDDTEMVIQLINEVV